MIHSGVCRSVPRTAGFTPSIGRSCRRQSGSAGLDRAVSSVSGLTCVGCCTSAMAVGGIPKLAAGDRITESSSRFTALFCWMCGVPTSCSPAHTWIMTPATTILPISPLYASVATCSTMPPSTGGSDGGMFFVAAPSATSSKSHLWSECGSMALGGARLRLSPIGSGGVPSPCPATQGTPRKRGVASAKPILMVLPRLTAG